MSFEWNQIKSSTTVFFSDKVAVSLKRAWLAILTFIKNFKIFPPADQEQEIPPAPPVTDAQWKEEALEDFKLWLSEIPSADPPVKSVTPDTCDLYTMMSQFIALRQEIKLQNREQHRTSTALSGVKDVTDNYGQIFKLFQERTSQLAQLEQNIRLNCEKRSGSHFFDVRDSLVRGQQASVEIAAKRGLFTRPPKGIESICEGYEMAINRFDKALSMLDIEPVVTHQMPFNPETMKAVESREVRGVEDGTVLETVSGGFVRGKEVLCHAKVVVAHVPDAPSDAN